MNLLFTSNTAKTIKESIFNLIQDEKVSNLTIAMAYNSSGETTKKIWKLVKNLEISIDFYFLQDTRYSIDPAILEYTKDKDNVSWYIMDTGFHTKMIYGENVGIYVGSANMTNSAMDSNFEIGVYEEYKNIDKDSLLEYIHQLKNNAVKIAISKQDKLKVFENIKECYSEYKISDFQSKKYNDRFAKFFPEQNKNTSYNMHDKKYTATQRNLKMFFDTMFEVVYPMIENIWGDIPKSMQKLEFTWVVDQILYNMARYENKLDLAIDKLYEYEKDHINAINQYRQGHKIIKKREFSDENKDELIKLAESSYAIITRPHMKQETKFNSYVDSWLKGSTKYTFQEVMDYFLDSYTDDIIVRFSKVCNNQKDYKVENLAKGSLGDILGMALLKHPKYDKCYPISNNLIQKFVIENYSER